jgi:hypothetical protein
MSGDVCHIFIDGWTYVNWNEKPYMQGWKKNLACVKKNCN